MKNKLQKSSGNIDIEIINNDLQCFYQGGCYKTIIPKTYSNFKELILINTSGGITSGDKLNAKFEFLNSKVCISTQAAEKIYSGFGLPAKVSIELNIKNQSFVFWLPRELILFNNCNLERRINVNLLNNSNLFMSETVVFGRKSVNEKIISRFINLCY